MPHADGVSVDEEIHVRRTAEAIQRRDLGAIGVIDLIIYGLMSLRQNDPPAYYFRLTGSSPRGAKWRWMIVVMIDDRRKVVVRLIDLVENSPEITIHDSKRLFQDVVKGHWDYAKTRDFLAKTITHPSHTYAAVLTAPKVRLEEGRQIEYEMLYGYRPLPLPVVRVKKSLFQRGSWRKSPVNPHTHLPVHISAKRRTAPSPRPRSRSRSRSPPPPAYKTAVGGRRRRR